MRKLGFCLNFILILLLLNGCRAPVDKKNVDIENIKLDREKEGFYHIVKKGETLTSISNKYNINVEILEEINKLPDKNRIEEGQMLFVPEVPDSYLESQKSKVDFIWPIRAKVVSFFNKEEEDYNPGIDIKVPANSQIVAVADGKVTFVSDENIGGDGKIIMIKHFGSLSSVYIFDGNVLVKEQDVVKQGQLLMENSSKYSFKILHFEIRKNHIPQNPYYFLPR